MQANFPAMQIIKIFMGILLRYNELNFLEMKLYTGMSHHQNVPYRIFYIVLRIFLKIATN